jgi:type I restriction enzyme S subunit
MFEKYSEYKDSEIEWLGDIPKHWKLKKVKHLYSIGRGRVISQQELVDDGLYPVYSSQTLDNGVLGYINTYDFDRDQITWTTDGANAGTIFLRRGKYNCTNVCGTLKPTYQEQKLEYIAYVLHFVAQYYKRPDTNGAKIMNGEMAEIVVTFPSLPEQTAIANFLDRKTAQIDQAVSIKEKQIELLKERRQILIHNAVTRGLDPDVKMRDSGVEWIGEIPENWEVKKLKYFSIVQSGITLGKSYVSKNVITYPYLRVANVQSGYFNLDQMAEISMPKREADKYLVRKGDILVTEGGDLDKLGRGTVWNGEIENCLHQNHVFAVRVDTSIISPQFASILMESDYGRKYFTNTANKTTNLASTNSTKLGNFPVIIAPKEEREAIFEYLKDVTSKIVTAISLKQKEIEKLREYKLTLINSAVTGKIKVA